MKYLKLLVILIFTLVLLYAASDLPLRGNPDNRMNQEVSITGTEVPGNYYIQEAYNDAHTPNIVTVVLGDYRSIDTLGEQIVIFTAGIICFLLLRKRGRKDDE
ncbi:hydrogen gas-evolving membrane-bound hydrogenase subunit E [Fodinibius sp.]|uniref:hydrogen gas-evolving membrane-bound hydrogenase subunit E n=1 Tax=Fodinibius sp. TaxID=1872440 RepID=UPI002ACE02EE|nr:hydrogen gas-evolving membrane-bound hydrogenase subunit E [Fodinibius sp.]MDZ7658641.1 hydrogen gas-evolving membrane-bound hydrogenase subunit E [Fodinibius sp.]